MNWMRRLRALAGMLAVAACAKPPADQVAAAPVIDSAAVMAAPKALWARVAAAEVAGDVPALAALVHDSVVVEEPGMAAMVGKASWQSTVEALFKDTKVSSLVITPERTIPMSNELVYENGTYVEESVTKGKKSQVRGRYATSVMKGADGQWRMRYLMGFPDTTIAIK